MDYIPIQGGQNVTLLEYILIGLYSHFNIDNKFFNRVINRTFKREIKRVYHNLEFKYAIHFTGYEKNMMHLIGNMQSKKIIFVHSDMLKEEKLRKNFHKKSLIKAYKNFDTIALVREGLSKSLEKYLSKKNQKKMCVVHNLNTIDVILENKNKEIIFDQDTYSNIDLNRLKQILDDKNSNKFINVSRFSPEKGLDRLITAFNKFQQINSKNYLIMSALEPHERLVRGKVDLRFLVNGRRKRPLSHGLLRRDHAASRATRRRTPGERHSDRRGGETLHAVHAHRVRERRLRLQHDLVPSVGADGGMPLRESRNRPDSAYREYDKPNSRIHSADPLFCTLNLK